MLRADHGREAAVAPLFAAALRERTCAVPARAALRVLASSSSGNCSVLAIESEGRRRIALIDLGLSPRRTSALLAAMKLSLGDVTDVFLTHLDTDHCNTGWAGRMPLGATLRVHRRHLGRAERAGMLPRRTEPFDGSAFELAPGVMVSSVLLSHDSLGVAAFRFDVGQRSFGYATDVGRITGGLLELLSGVDVLAIESNYCPRMQLASRRPAMLKRRIMGGAGHLSNEQCREAVDAIAPRAHVVLLHLSRQCNAPHLAASLHEGAPYMLTVSAHDRPTPWVTAEDLAAAQS